MALQRRSDGSVVLPPQHMPTAIERELVQAVLALMRRMHSDILKECREIFDSGDMGLPPSGTMDASVASQARIRINALLGKWVRAFKVLAEKQVERMVSQCVRSSAAGINASLKELAEGLSIDTRKSDERLSEVIKTSSDWAAKLIVRIPQKYLDDVQANVAKSITTGQGLQDLVPYLTAQYKGNERWAKHVAMDQTRKTYEAINTAQLQKVGSRSFVWCHSGGSKFPRKHHIEMDGKEFRYDEPPVIEKATKTKPAQRGLPGDAIFCRCFKKPVFRFDEDDDAD